MTDNEQDYPTPTRPTQAKMYEPTGRVPLTPRREMYVEMYMEMFVEINFNSTTSSAQEAW